MREIPAEESYMRSIEVIWQPDEPLGPLSLCLGCGGRLTTRQVLLFAFEPGPAFMLHPSCAAEVGKVFRDAAELVGQDCRVH